MTSVWSAGTATPILPVADLDRAAKFYRGIGFDVEPYDGDYAFVRGGGLSIDLARSSGFDPFVSAGMAYILVNDADAAHAALVATGLLADYYRLDGPALHEKWARGESLARITGIEDKPWGMREFALSDADNNLLRIGTALKR